MYHGHRPCIGRSRDSMLETGATPMQLPWVEGSDNIPLLAVECGSIPIRNTANVLFFFFLKTFIFQIQP